MRSLQIAMLISFSIAAACYIILKYWVLPIYSYIKTKKRILAVLRRINAIIDNNSDAVKSSPELQDLLASARQLCLDLVSDFNYGIPVWYRLKLKSRRESPEDASKSLLRLTSFQQMDHARNRLGETMAALGDNGKALKWISRDKGSGHT